MRFRTAAVLAGVFGAGCAEESRPGAAAAAKVGKLPEFYGIYAAQGEGYKLLRAGTAPEEQSVEPGAAFLIFDKAVASRLGAIASRPVLMRLAWIRCEVAGMTSGAAHAEAAEARVAYVEEWQEEGEVLECRTRPVEGSAEMILIVPSSPMAGGAHVLEPIGLRFTVGPARREELDRFPDGLRPTSVLDGHREARGKLVEEAFEGKKWEEALGRLEFYRRIATRDVSIRVAEEKIRRERVKELMEKKEFEEALRRLGEEREWMGDEVAYEEALAAAHAGRVREAMGRGDWKLAEERLREGLQRLPRDAGLLQLKGEVERRGEW
jgi:hypothetical protein